MQCTNGDSTPDVQMQCSQGRIPPRTLCKLGEALYIRNKNRERARKAAQAVDYLADQGVFDG